jgi:hypothetical protein
VLNSVRPLSLADAEALVRAPYVLNSVPVVAGSASVEARGRERSVTVYAVGPDFDKAFKFDVTIGSFLPPDELERGRNAFCHALRDGPPIGEGVAPVADDEPLEPREVLDGKRTVEP